MGDPVATCPCCRQAVITNKLVVDLNTNQVSYRGRTIDCWPPMAVEFLWALNDKWPGTLSHTDAYYALWGNSEPEGARGCVAVYACMLRKIVKVFGVGIISVSGRGFRLVLP